MNLNRVLKSRVGFLLGPLAAALTSGCGSKTAKLSGKVLFQGRPLPGGLVTFYPTDGHGKPASAVIGEDGAYLVNNAPVVTVKVTVSNLALKKGDHPPIGMDSTSSNYGMAPKDVVERAREGKKLPLYEGSRTTGSYVPIPTAFADVKTTGLTYTVDSKNDDFDIVLR
jgi:hypothetical protein